MALTLVFGVVKVETTYWTAVLVKAGAITKTMLATATQQVAALSLAIAVVKAGATEGVAAMLKV